MQRDASGAQPKSSTETTLPSTYSTRFKRHAHLPQHKLRALRNVRGLRPFLAFSNLELYCIAFLKTFISLGSDRAVMNKNIGTVGAPDEPVPFGVIEPLDRTFQSFHVPPLSARHPKWGDPDVPL